MTKENMRRSHRYRASIRVLLGEAALVVTMTHSYYEPLMQRETSFSASSVGALLMAVGLSSSAIIAPVLSIWTALIHHSLFHQLSDLAAIASTTLGCVRTTPYMT